MDFGELISNAHYDKYTPVINNNKISNGVGNGTNGEIIHDENFMRYVGWSEDYSYNPSLSMYFNQNTVDTISRQVTQNLEGVGPNNRPIIVTDDVISHVMSNVYQDRRGKVGDIYTIFNITDSVAENIVLSMIDRSIEIITTNITTEYGMIETNSKLTKWTTVLGDFNVHGIRSHPIIKVREKNTNHRGQVSFMNY